MHRTVKRVIFIHIWATDLQLIIVDAHLFRKPQLAQRIPHREHSVSTVKTNHENRSNIRSRYVEIKYQLDATEVFIVDLIACSTCFGHHYAHHQELKSIIQWLLPVVFGAVVFKLLVWCGAEGYVSGLHYAAFVELRVVCPVCRMLPFSKAASCKPDTQPSAPHRTNNLKTTAPNTTGSNHCIILLSSWWWA